MIRYTIRVVMDSMGKEGAKPRIKLVFSNGSTHQKLPGTPDIVIVFKNRKAEWRTFFFGSVGFMESYRDSDIDLEGDNALRTLIRASYETPNSDRAFIHPLVWVRKKFLEMRQNNKSHLQTKKNLYRHYNMPAEFFHLMTGELYGYTEGYYETGNETQDEAQFKKYDYICRKLCLTKGDNVIEVGSAWGTLAMLMAKKYGANVVNYGLVEEQNRIMRERLKDKNLEDKVRIEVRDARNLRFEPERYDKYVSLGVFEHAGKDCQKEWIEGIAACLKPGGVGVMSMVGRMQHSLIDYLIGKYIWFGCYLPSMSSLFQLMEQHDLHIVDVENVRLHYARTMEVMLQKMLEHWEEIQKIDPELFDEKFKRVWTMYYTGSIETLRLEGRTLQAYHAVFVKGRKDVYPHTRDFLYEKPYDLGEIGDYAVPFQKTGPFSAEAPVSSVMYTPSSGPQR